MSYSMNCGNSYHFNYLPSGKNEDTYLSFCPVENPVEDQWTWNHLDKSTEVILFGQKRKTVLFHPGWSKGTAGVRGSRILNGDRVYWEIYLSHRIFGTSIMFGVGTEKAFLYEPDFVNLLGKDDQSWGLSHKGLIWHDGKSAPFARPFDDNRPTTVGLYFDGIAGTLTYFKDGVYLGVAFRNLHKFGCRLYPIIASSAARTVMSLIRTIRSRTVLPLQQICINRLYESTLIDSNGALLSTAMVIVENLDLPQDLKNRLKLECGKKSCDIFN